MQTRFVGPALPLLLLLAAALASAADNALPDGKAGLKVGAKAPEFALLDQSGKRRSLKELLRGGPVALVFFRSAEW